jgi:two-component system cell cycle sensor histidine kinase/response regulator CckA
LDVNDAHVKLYGYSREELMGGMIAPDLSADYETSLESVRQIATGRTIFVPLRYHKKKDGTVFPVEIVGGSYLFKGRRVMFAMVRDIGERQRAEEALRESETKFRSYIQSAPLAIFVAERDGRVADFNPAARDLLGYDAATLSKMHILDLHPEEDNEDISRKFATLLSEGHLETECRMKKSDGQPIWVSLHAVMITDQFSLAYCQDITERKRSEEALKQSERNYREIFNSAKDSIFIHDAATGTILDVNESMLQLYGLSREEALGLPPDECSLGESPYSALEARQWIVKAVTEGPQVFEWHARKKSGELFWVEVALKSANISGRDRVLAIVRDLTDRKLMDAERTLLATAVQQAEENVLVTDERRTIIYINPAFERSSGYRSEELKGQKLRVLRSAQHDEIFYRKMQETLDRGEVWIGVIINKAKDGSDFEIEGTISPIRDASGAITHYVAAGRNMSRLRRLERELHQAQKMESIGRLAGGVAHDFNNMLGIILGHAEMALDEFEPGQPIFSDLREIQKAAKRSADLTRQLLAFARKQTVAPKVLDLNESVEGMLKMLRRLIGEDIDLAWMPGKNLWPVKVDHSQLDQMLANLCVNARDAIVGVGKITIETANATLDESHCIDNPEFVPGEFVLMTVRDNGCGMDEDILENIFEPFFTTKELGKGTGLGLAVIYGIVKQNNGFIDVRSEQDRGTTFRIYLPRADISKPEANSLVRLEKDLKGTETVLLVEDEKSMLALAKTVLERSGYAVLAAADPLEALDLAKNHSGRIHLLITDVIMPGMNGKELAERLGDFKTGFRCIFMSGYTDDVIARHGVIDERVHFLQKPFSVKSLAEKVRKALDE